MTRAPSTRHCCPIEGFTGSSRGHISRRHSICRQQCDSCPLQRHANQHGVAGRQDRVCWWLGIILCSSAWKQLQFHHGLSLLTMASAGLPAGPLWPEARSLPRSSWLFFWASRIRRGAHGHKAWSIVLSPVSGGRTPRSRDWRFQLDPKPLWLRILPQGALAKPA